MNTAVQQYRIAPPVPPYNNPASQRSGAHPPGSAWRELPEVAATGNGGADAPQRIGSEGGRSRPHSLLRALCTTTTKSTASVRPDGSLPSSSGGVMCNAGKQSPLLARSCRELAPSPAAAPRSISIRFINFFKRSLSRQLPPPPLPRRSRPEANRIHVEGNGLGPRSLRVELHKTKS